LRSGPASLLTVAPIWTVLSVGVWADDVDLGREVYDDFCVACYGRDMVPPPGGMTSDLRKFHKDDFERFRKALLEGKSLRPCRPGVTRSVTTTSSCFGRTCGAGARDCRECEGWLDPQMDGEGAIP
jgi:hypothetical protein